MTDQEGDDFWTTEAMIRYGGSFVKLIGKAYRQADPGNQAKIKRTWPEYWEEYTQAARRSLWVERAEAEAEAEDRTAPGPERQP